MPRYGPDFNLGYLMAGLFAMGVLVGAAIAVGVYFLKRAF